MRCVLRTLYAWGLALATVGLLQDCSIPLSIIGAVLIGVGSLGWED